MDYNRKGNRLRWASSPYLLQHKDNPVDWYEWGEEALQTACKEKKPILLSIGYAACHWCHVMAHESFENPAIADRMNKLFVNIKVDREERPDLDAIYQQALALLGQQGGWPLTMFLSPDGRPFWGGTYFPPEARWGRPGFGDILLRIEQIYKHEPEKVASNSHELLAAMQRLAEPKRGEGIASALLKAIAQRLVEEVDPQYGGIGNAPKFPHIPLLEMFWRAFQQEGSQSFRDAVQLSATALCQGGIYDHIGGGMARYATDRRWLVPHFEKMLYDNAALLDLLAMVGAQNKDPLWRRRAEEIVSFLEQDMAGATVDGRRAFASSWDADSEGVEGQYYVWREEEIDSLLNEEAAELKRYYDVTPGGNWEGVNILNRLSYPHWLGDALEARLETSLAKLKQARDRRIPPGFDDKILLDWNGMVIQSLVHAGWVFERPDWIARAAEAHAFLQANLNDNKNGWVHSWRAGKKGAKALLDDHAQMALAGLTLFEACGDKSYLVAAQTHVEYLNLHFWDGEGGGYFTVPEGEKDIILRQKSAFDAATPNGNGIMLQVLYRLWFLTGQEDYRSRAVALEQCFSGEVERNFFPLATFLNSIRFAQNPLQVVIVAKGELVEYRRVLGRNWRPEMILQSIEPGAALPSHHPAFGKTGSREAVYICEGPLCSLPLTNIEELEEKLQARYK